ncbi:MAG: hypothetical protein HY785_13735 [Oscillatoriophycideae cyanobacterium NC_groundwater_1537_Pr4_S-0.65um_50_18]|nr:hypothetical protein [Oscillatoriophycideae cyanobacterium NC_groundwater_1537_Pr4_S-0.65um_50_18]
MPIQAGSRSISSRLHREPQHYRQKRRSSQVGLALGLIVAASALLSDQAAATPIVYPTRLANSVLLARNYPAVGTAQNLSASADSSSWLYQGIVQLSYAGVIIWVIALLQNSGK